MRSATGVSSSRDATDVGNLRERGTVPLEHPVELGMMTPGNIGLVDLIKRNRIIFTIFDVLAKVIHSERRDEKASSGEWYSRHTLGSIRPPSMIIEPSQKDLVRRQPQQIINRLSLLTQPIQSTCASNPLRMTCRVKPRIKCSRP